MLYGRMLLQHEPEATTELLVDLCSGQLGKKPATAPIVEEQDKGVNGGTGPAMLSYLGVNRVAGLFTGEAQASPTTPAAPNAQVNGSTITDSAIEVVDNAKGDPPTYDPPSPRRYFAHFVDHQPYFIRFLEAVAATRWSQTVSTIKPQSSGPLSPRPMDVKVDADEDATDQRAVWNTLLELYLASTRDSDASISTPSKQKALALLADLDKPYDPVHAMILCSTAGFTDGLVGLWESMGMYEDVLRYWMDQDKSRPAVNGSAVANGHGDGEGARVPSDEVLRCLDTYGPANLHLYPLVLRYLTSSPAILSRHSAQLPRLLQTIDENRILPPLAVIQLLSRNGVASVGNVKSWLKTKVEETRQDVESDKHLVESYRTETKEKEKELVALANPEQPEVFQVTRCAACQTQLDLPSVHFMCKHSYHQR